MRHIAAIALLLVCSAANAAAPDAVRDPSCFAIRIVDAQTGRGVPLVELETVDRERFYTDSAGLVAITDPSLLGHKVWFSVRSHGYEFPADGFGMRGAAFDLKPGGEAKLPIKRLNIAERLYRVTGRGIYRDTIIAGGKAPIAEPLLNGQVLGQDTVQSVVYRGKIHWFWGDTQRPSYPLGHFGTAGATSDLPGQGGLDPAVGVDLKYFVDAQGFSRPMCPEPKDGMKWIDGLMLLKDEKGGERLVAHLEVHKSLTEVTRRELIVYSDAADTFETLAVLAADVPLCPAGHPVRLAVDGQDYYYFPTPYPIVRVRADMTSVKDPAAYEAFTCLVAGSRYDKDHPKLDRDAAGRLAWAWKKDTDRVDEERQAALLAAGKIKADDAWFRLRDVETKKPVRLHGGSVAYNAFRRRWIAIAVEAGGASSFLGEIWYSEADKPEGPWLWARKIVTHDRYSFYNPKHHPFFDQEGGRIIYFEGTYTITFSRESDPTPRYDYNQVMYRLDLSDERLKLPHQ